MKSNERIAYCRVFSDLIMADSVIDADEMDYFTGFRADFRLSRQEEIEAKGMTLAEAIGILRESDKETREELVSRCRALSVSDGFCARLEALLIMGVARALDDLYGEVSHIYSFPKNIFDIPTSCLIYIEGEPAECVDNLVERNYRGLFSEFRLGGFEFIYIPEIIRHYREAEPGLMERIAGFIAPQLSEERRREGVEKLLRMTTYEFTKDILCNKLGMDSLRNTTPAFFLKIGTSFVGDTIYSNYLKMDIEGDLMRDVHEFLDEFTSMLSSDVVIVSNNREQHNQFLYAGFYKLLLDMHLMRRNVRSRIFINPYKEEISFPDIDTVLHGLHRREKALYLTMLVMSSRGGVNFASPATSRQREAYDRRMNKLQEMYRHFYGIFGGDKDKAPDLRQSDIRRPMLSLIKRQLGKLSGQLLNIGDYVVSKDKDNTLFIHLDSSLVEVKDGMTGDMVPLTEWIKTSSQF